MQHAEAQLWLSVRTKVLQGCSAASVGDGGLGAAKFNAALAGFLLTSGREKEGEEVKLESSENLSGAM